MQNDFFDSSNPLAQFSRTIDLLGADGFERLQRSFVIVIGLGGVGAHAAVALARSGVGRMRLIDFDLLSPTSLNRHAFATRADVGTPKTELTKRHLEAINPEIQIETSRDFFHLDTADELLGGEPDMIVDAIDGVNPKVMLLRTCVERGMPVVSSMGASARTNPGLIRIGDISETIGCPLARVVRRRLRRLGIQSGVPCVFSAEQAIPSLEPDTDEETMQRGRTRRRLPSLGVIPGMFGYALAGLVVTRLAEYNAPVAGPSK